jgi:hypothetical protein
VKGAEGKMDPVISGALGSALAEAIVFVGREFAKEALIKPGAGPVANKVRDWANRRYNAVRDDAALQQAVQKALKSGDFGLVELKLAEIAAPGRPELRQQVATAILSMASDQPDQVPAEVVKALRLPDRSRPVLAKFLWALRQQLAGHKGFGPLIAFADRAASRELLRHLAETVVETPEGKAVQVMIVEPPRSTADIEALRRDYLDYLSESCHWLDFRGILQMRQVVRLPTAEVFVPLKVTPLAELRPERLLQEAERIREKVPIQELLPHYRRLVILGDPGAGKTTFLRYVALARAAGPAATEERLGVKATWLPVLLPIAAYTEKLKEVHDLPLTDYLSQYFQARELPDLGPLFRAEMERGNCLFLHRQDPDYFCSCFGFRVVVSPGSP